ncbi:hypothetical protein DFI02_1315 [Rhizobium sp. PP-F2F-G20b]|nr:hypothetical protein DFI02_1315 [Rhizobium sp. PP-F2F-G20b]
MIAFLMMTSGGLGAYVGYRGSIAPDAFAFAVRMDPDLLTQNYPDGGPYPEYGFLLLYFVSLTIFIVGTILFAVWLIRQIVETFRSRRSH